MIRLDAPEMEAILEAPVPTARTSETSLAENVVFLGLDTEWDAKLPNRPLLSVQLAGYVGETRRSRCYDPPGPRLTTDSLLDLVLRFARDEGIVLPTSTSRKRKSPRCTIVLLAHFAGAEIGMIRDHFRDLCIQPIGQKGNHAVFPPMARDDVVYSIRLLDTFAFFPVGLAVLGDAVGLPKIDVGPRDDLARLKKENPNLFDSYARRDAEIVLDMYRQFRDYMWSRY